MQLFPDSTPKYVTDTSEQAQLVRTGNGGGLFGGCGFLGLLPKAPQYVGANQAVGCPDSSLLGGLFDVAQPHYVQPPPPSTTSTASTAMVARTLPSSSDRTLADVDKPKR